MGWVAGQAFGQEWIGKLWCGYCGLIHDQGLVRYNLCGNKPAFEWVVKPVSVIQETMSYLFLEAVSNKDNPLRSLTVTDASALRTTSSKGIMS